MLRRSKISTVILATFRRSVIKASYHSCFNIKKCVVNVLLDPNHGRIRPITGNGLGLFDRFRDEIDIRKDRNPARSGGIRAGNRRRRLVLDRCRNAAPRHRPRDDPLRPERPFRRGRRAACPGIRDIVGGYADPCGRCLQSAERCGKDRVHGFFVTYRPPLRGDRCHRAGLAVAPSRMLALYKGKPD